MKTNCAQCGEDIDRKPADIKRYTNLFCSKECSGLFRSSKVKVICSHCDKPLLRMPSEIKKSDSGKFFCNKSCFASYSNLGKVRNWKDGASSYRERALRELPNKCNRCGYKEYTKVLEVHHKDHDRANNSLNNLEVLCPTCHTVEHLINEDIKIV